MYRPDGALTGRAAGGAWWLPVLAGVLLVLAFYTSLLPLNFVAFVPMLAWIDRHLAEPPGEIARGALRFGLSAYGIGLHWVFAVLAFSWLGVLMYLGLVVLFTAGAVAGLTLAGWLRRRTGWSFGLLLPVCWIPMEWLRTWGDLRMTADHVSHSLARYPFLVQFDDVVGPYGVGAFLLVVNGLLYEGIRGWRSGEGRRAWILMGLVFAVVLGYDAWAWTHPPGEAGRVRVGLVQPNIPLAMKHDAAEDARQQDRLAELTREAAARGAELIVWPESARPRPLFHWLARPETLAMPEVQQLAVETGAAILTGVEYYRVRSEEDWDLYNAALVVDPQGRISPEWTAKSYLVPFTEGVPFRSILGPLLGGLRGGLRWLSGGFSPGPAAGTLPVLGRRAGVLVCFEQLFWDLPASLRRQGASFQVVITNDAWWGRTVFQAFQAHAVRMRAIENRCAFVRVANTGISGFVDPLGRYHGWTGLFRPEVEVRDVPLTTGRTLYNRVGDAAAWLAIAGLGLAVVEAVRRRGPRRPS